MSRNFSTVTFLYVFGIVALFCSTGIYAWGGEKKIKLKDVQTLTLHQGQMTNGRRSSPVPQLNCVGGTAGCNAFVPQVVQCYNRGFDGYDTQWECKTDMDNAYRFGRVQVTCEGYDYPDDPYILKGSCGLEYTIDFTKEGNRKSNGNYQYDYHQSDGGGNNDYYTKSKNKSGLGDLIILAIVGIIGYAIYRTCLVNPVSGHEGGFNSGSSGFDSPPYPPGGPQQRPSWFSSFFGGGGHGGAPPPAGFRPEYTSGESCGGTSGSSGGSGFWTGAATGGILGYMFGNRNSGSSGYSSSSTSGTSRRREAPSSYDSWGGTGGSSADAPSSGTRTASGFGETRRR